MHQGNSLDLQNGKGTLKVWVGESILYSMWQEPAEDFRYDPVPQAVRRGSPFHPVPVSSHLDNTGQPQPHSCFLFRVIPSSSHLSSNPQAGVRWHAAVHSLSNPRKMGTEAKRIQ